MNAITPLPIKKIAVFRALKLGDFLLAVPALRALRQAFPEAGIDYIGLPWMRDVRPRYGVCIDGFVEFPGYPSLPERAYDPAAIVQFMQKMQETSYDLTLQMHGNGRNANVLVELLGSKNIAGYSCHDAFWPNRQWFMTYPEDKHEIHKHLSLLQFLGIDATDTTLEFPLHDNDYAELEEIGNFKDRQYICMHPGAVSGARWPAEYFAKVGDELASQGLEIVITGSREEAALASHVAALMKAPSINIAGRTSLGALGALLCQSRLLVSNDTGVAHMAVAVGRPNVTIFTTANPAIWAALDEKRHPHFTAEQATLAAVIKQSVTLLKETA
jgi:ADP-heptose:LPS heptosyltransferase